MRPWPDGAGAGHSPQQLRDAASPLRDRRLGGAGWAVSMRTWAARAEPDPRARAKCSPRGSHGRAILAGLWDAKAAGARTYRAAPVRAEEPPADRGTAGHRAPAHAAGRTGPPRLHPREPALSIRARLHLLRRAPEKRRGQVRGFRLRGNRMSIVSR